MTKYPKEAKDTIMYLKKIWVNHGTGFSFIN